MFKTFRQLKFIENFKIQISNYSGIYNVEHPLHRLTEGRLSKKIKLYLWCTFKPRF